MTSKNTRKLGSEAEDLAAAYLETKGFFIVDRNYFFERSEVDIVGIDEQVIVFIEVKMRRTLAFGHPEEAVDDTKILSIQKAAEAWIYERKMDGYPVRFDVVSILQLDESAPDIKHIKDAFR